MRKKTPSKVILGERKRSDVCYFSFGLIEKLRKLLVFGRIKIMLPRTLSVQLR